MERRTPKAFSGIAFSAKADKSVVSGAMRFAMPIVRIAATAFAVAASVARHPITRVVLRQIGENARMRAGAEESIRVAAYTAGRIVRVALPRTMLR